MDFCVVDFAFRELDNRNIMALFVIFGLAFSFKNKGAAVLALVTALFYWVSYSLHCDFKLMDPNRVWRYIFWTGIDVLYIITVYLAVIRFKLISYSIFKSIILLHVIAWLLHCVRLLDVHLVKNDFTDSFYSIGIASYNIALICVIALALILPVYNKLIRRYGVWNG